MKNKNLAALAVSIITLLIPLFLIEHDLWDGVIISYGSSLEDLSGIKFWFFQAGWHLQYYQIIVFHYLSLFLNLEYIILNKLIIWICFFFILKEISYLLHKVYSLENRWLFLTFIFLGSAPSMAVLSSSVMGFHWISLLIGLIGVRVIRQEKIILGSILLFAAFSYPAILGLSIGISYFLDSSAKEKKYFPISLQIYKPSNFTIYIFLIAVIFYISHKLIFEPYGFWENYYSLRSPFELKGFLVISYRLLEFLSHFIILGITLFVCVCIYPKKIKAISIQFNHDKAFGLIFFIFSSFITFVMVGKSASIIDVYDWSTRHVMPFYIPFSIFIGIFLKWIYETFDRNFLFVCIPLAINLFLGIYSWNDKFQRDEFFKTFKEFAALNETKLSKRYVKIIRDNKPSIRSYEYNYLYFLTHQNSDVFISETDFSMESATDKLFSETFGLTKEEILISRNLNFQERLSYLEKVSPMNKNALKLYLVSNIDSVLGYEEISDPLLTKWYGKEPGIEVKRFLKKLSDDILENK